MTGSPLSRLLLIFITFFFMSIALGQTVPSHADLLLQELADPSSSYVFVAAHRGGWEHDWRNRAPENSLANIDKAFGMGFDVFESDLNMSRDGVFVIMHDETVDRTTTGTGAVQDLTLPELQALNLVYRNGRVSSETVPTFEAFLERAKGKLLFKLDYRAPLETFPEAVALVEDMGMLGQVFFRFDYDEESAATLQRFLDEGMPWHPNLIMFRTRTPEEVSAALAQFDLGIIEVFFEDEEITEEGLAAADLAREAGLLVETHSWGGRRVWDSLVDEGFRMFHTRQPERMVSYLNSQGHRRLFFR